MKQKKSKEPERFAMLNNLLLQNRDTIIARWFDLILGTYPADTSGFLRKEKNRFNNPVGYTISKEIVPIYDTLSLGQDLESIAPSLEKIIKIRAVQDFSPSEALSFVALLKRAIREELVDELDTDGLAGELLGFESRIDRLMEMAIDIFSQRREKIFEIKVHEIKARSYKLLERANLLDKLDME